MEFKIHNPRRNYIKEKGKSGWYNYYAGYSTDFVRDIISHINLPEGSLIMDPWNGSGTTTQVVEEMGYKGLGLDINPVMVLVAKARQLRPDVAPSIPSIHKDILDKAKRHITNLNNEEPLEKWLQKSTAVSLRNLEGAVQELLLNENEYKPIHKIEVERISSLAAFFYVALFRTARIILKPFRTSNPTWIKIANTNEAKLQISQLEIWDQFNKQVFDMIQMIESQESVCVNKFSGCSKIKMGNSLQLPVDTEVVDGVVTSPPYCTRIDYAIATLPELAVCGIPVDNEFKTFRNLMIGSPTVGKDVLMVNPNWGASCLDFLHLVYNHPSKASKTYYYKTYVQYFNSIYNSLIEIRRTLKKQGVFVIVVQDSYYKNIHVDITKIYEEMTRSLSLDLESKFEYIKLQTLAGINQRSLSYRNVAGKATESVLVLKKV